RGRYLRRCTIRSRAQQFFGDRLAGEILHLEILAVPIRQGRDEFGLNFQRGNNGSVEIKMNFHIVIFVETATNEFGSRQFAIRRDSELRGYDCFKLRSASSKLRLRHNPVAIGVELDKLSCVPDREDPRRLQAVRARTTCEASQPGTFGQPPGITPLPKPGWIWLIRVSPPKILRREKPGSSGLAPCCVPLPASRHGPVDKSTLIKSGIKIPAMSVRPVSTSGNVPLKII